MKMKVPFLAEIFALLLLIHPLLLQAENLPRCEHPRPDLLRANWQCLNGEWEFQVDNKPDAPDRYDQKITVPFEMESPLSGVSFQRAEKYYMKYRKRFSLAPGLNSNGRIILHFEAVDYQAQVWLNGNYLGEHIGGYTPFSFDVSDLIRDSGNELIVKVFDSSHKSQVRGKQSSTGTGYSIWYTPTSGIWQTVWLERVGQSHIKNYQAFPELERGEVKFKFQISNPGAGQKISIIAFDPEGREVKTNLQDIPAENSRDLIWKIQNIRLWSPEEPNLYRLKFILSDEKSAVIDELESYLGLREVKVKDGRVILNGKPVYQKLALVQGYYPPGIYSPANDDAFRKDLELLKEMGFNGLRMHQKIEAKRYYYWADKLGLLVWEEMPAINSEPPDMFLPAGKKWREQFEKEWHEVIERDFNHPSIIVRVPFNESWGIWSEIYSPVHSQWAMKIIKLTRELDPTRLLVDNSGWLHRDTDIVDVHHYLPTAEKSELFYQKLRDPRGTYFLLTHSLIRSAQGIPTLPPLYRGVKYKGQPIIISEYGGFGFYKTEPKALIDNYREYTLAIGKYAYIQGFCYTQEYDVEQEKNGLLDENRNPKVPLAEIKKVNDQIGQ